MPGFKIYQEVGLSPPPSVEDSDRCAYRLSYWQISGGDAWIGKDQYEIEAKPPASVQPASPICDTLVRNRR